MSKPSSTTPNDEDNEPYNGPYLICAEGIKDRDGKLVRTIEEIVCALAGERMRQEGK